MKKLSILASFLLLFCACANDDTPSPAKSAEDDLNAGSNFIRATLDGDYSKARTLILRDSINEEKIHNYERAYNEKMKEEDKKAYKAASVHIHKLDKLNDSTSILTYSNSYFKKDTHLLRIVRINQQWLVDFKSYFEDSLMHRKKDSLP